MEGGDRPVRGDGKDEKAKAPDPKPTKLNQEAADLMNKRAPQAERPNTADKHLPKVEITDQAAERRAAQQQQMRQKSGREGPDKAQEAPQKKGPEK